MEIIIVIILLIIIAVWALIKYSDKRYLEDTTKQVVTEHLKMRSYRDSFNSPSNDKTFPNLPLGQIREVKGVRMCSVCGKGWESTAAQLKDSGLQGDITAGGGHFQTAYSPANLMGLTCQKCGRAFCNDHLGQPIPSSLPGGSCPICMGTLDLA